MHIPPSLIAVVLVSVVSLFGVIMYAIHHDRDVKAAMKMIGVSFTFEAQKAEVKPDTAKKQESVPSEIKKAPD